MARLKDNELHEREISEPVVRRAIRATASMLATTCCDDTVADLMNATLSSDSNDIFTVEQQMIGELFFDQITDDKPDCIAIAQGEATAYCETCNLHVRRGVGATCPNCGNGVIDEKPEPSGCKDARTTISPADDHELATMVRDKIRALRRSYGDAWRKVLTGSTRYAIAYADILSPSVLQQAAKTKGGDAWIVRVTFWIEHNIETD